MHGAIVLGYQILSAAGERIQYELGVTLFLCVLLDCFLLERSRKWTWKEPSSRYLPRISLFELSINVSSIFFGFFTETLMAYHQSFPSLRLDPTPVSWSCFFAEVVVLALLMDTYFYWVHRSLHHHSVYSLIHRLHHRSKQLTPLSAASFSALELFIMSLGMLSLISFPSLYHFHRLPFLIFALSGHLLNMTYHFGVEFCPSWFYSYWPTKNLVTASYHAVHHLDPRYHYGLYFTHWDRLANTVKPGFDQLYAARWLRAQ